MNYYIITSEVFESLNKENISYMLKSVDNSKNIVITSDNIDGALNTFSNTTELSNYTFTNSSDWVGDGSGIEEWEFEDFIYDYNIDV
tara:strand:+ start:643 stop:903 length:261 start_codon:yes stop_codon:yes gene_type:complete